MGETVGPAELGTLVGCADIVGTAVGLLEGCAEGCEVGPCTVGAKVGTLVGTAVGAGPATPEVLLKAPLVTVRWSVPWLT